MKQRGWPIWLLRDVRAFAAVMLSFWTLVIFTITNERRAMREGKFRDAFHARVAKLVASAESRLDHAFWREAYRRLGWSARSAPFSIIAPPQTAETCARFRAYHAAFSDMESVVRSYVEHLRQQYRISERALVAHGSTEAALCAAAHHERVGASRLFSATSPFALTTHRVRPSKDTRSYTHARAPPLTFPKISNHPPRSLTCENASARPIAARVHPASSAAQRSPSASRARVSLPLRADRPSRSFRPNTSLASA